MEETEQLEHEIKKSTLKLHAAKLEVKNLESSIFSMKIKLKNAYIDKSKIRNILRQVRGS